MLKILEYSSLLSNLIILKDIKVHELYPGKHKNGFNILIVL
jgi:hypothetical protein